MAFTKEQIDHAINNNNGLIQGYYEHHVCRFSDSAIYEPIVDYLTRKTSSLPSLQMDQHGYAVVLLISLLNNIESPTANDHLLLQVIRHPDLEFAMKYSFSNWLMNYALQHKGNRALQAIVTQYKSIGMNNDEIFSHFVFSLSFGNREKINIENTAVKEFLVDHLRKAKSLPYPNQTYSLRNDEWNMFYFLFLEEVRPEWASEYALFGATSDRNNPMVFLESYRKGHYMAVVIQYLRNKQNPSLATIQSKLNSAIQLYNINSSSYKEIALELSGQYLDYLIVHNPTVQWESGAHLTDLNDEDNDYFTYSACALHFLFKYERNKAIEILKSLFTKKVFVSYKSLEIVNLHLGSEAFPYVEVALSATGITIDRYRQLIDLAVRKFEPEQYLTVIWKLTGNKSKSLKELISRLLVEKDPQAETKAIELLNSKSADTRQTAALILTHIPSVAAKEAIMVVLHKESNDNARDILLQSLADSLPAAGDNAFIEDMIAAARERGKLNKPIEPWLEESSLSPLYDHSGNLISQEYIRFLLYRMSRVKDMRSDIEAKYIIQLIDRDKSSQFALELIKKYIDKEAKPEFKWLMAVAALLGNDSVVDKIRITTNNWIDENRYKMAEHGVGALAIQGSDKALRWVEWYSRKYKSKKANVGAAALVALETAAEELGITTHELGDRIVPDFGFEGLFKHFTIDGEEYRAFIDSNFKLAYFNDNNKKLKSLPAAASSELKEEFKNIGKEVRDIVRSQSSRLEYYLIIQRRWELEAWQKFFLNNPVMFIYATKILWGVYNKEGKLLQIFLCNEDTSLIDVNNDEISIEQGNYIGIVHPTQLDPDLLQQWKKQFFDLSIDSIFPQLERRLPDMKDIDLSKTIITKFKGNQTATGSIRSTLERFGWHKGPTGDGGMIESFNLLYFEERLEAVLEIEGVGAGYGWGGDERTGRLYVTDKTKITTRWFNPPQKEDDERLVKLNDLPPIFLNEMLAAVEQIKPK